MEAEAPGPAPLDQLRLMLQTLLDDRFKLKIHRETNDMPIYSLVQVKDAGAPGLIRTPGGDCSTSLGDQPALPNGTGCGVVNLSRGRINGQRWRFRLRL
jgi:uncharacterized protein (TIGR03435 family)